MDSTELKDRQAYAFIQETIVRSGVTPSLRAIASAVGYHSPRSAQLQLKRLQRKGWIKLAKRIIKLRQPRSHSSGETTVDVPLLGTVACGSPSIADQQPECVIQVSRKLASPGHVYFLLRARGTSMNRSGIDNGDLVLVRRQPTAKQGDRVVVLVNNEATIKHFRRKDDVVALHPNSTDPSHQPIFVSADVVIQGVVVTALPRELWQRRGRRSSSRKGEN